jgi:hypothetical protein
MNQAADAITTAVATPAARSAQGRTQPSDGPRMTPPLQRFFPRVLPLNGHRITCARRTMSAPDTDVAVMRAGCLWALCERLVFDQEWRARAHTERAEIENFHRVLRAWMDREGLSPALSPIERQLFESLVGAWPDEKRLDLGWRIEGLGVLTWALGLLDVLPPFDTEAELDTFEPIYDTLAPLTNLAARAKLRPPAELAAAREQARQWHRRAMRAERFFAHAMGRAPRGATPPRSEPERIRKAIGGDIVLFGKPYSTLNAEEFSKAKSIAIERFHALNWLCDGGAWP